MGPGKASPAVRRNLGAFSTSTRGWSRGFANVWGRAPSTVMDGMAKGPDSDCRTHPCWVCGQTQAPEGAVPPVAECHPLPGPAVPTGAWPSTTRTCSSSARCWSSRSSRSSCGCSSRWVPVPWLSPCWPCRGDPAPQSPSSCRWMGGCQRPCATPEHGPEPAARRGAAASAGCQREGGAALGHGADGGGQDPLGVSGVSGLCCDNPTVLIPGCPHQPLMQVLSQRTLYTLATPIPALLSIPRGHKLSFPPITLVGGGCNSAPGLEKVVMNYCGEDFGWL